MKKFKGENSTQKLLDLIRVGGQKQVNELSSDDSAPSFPVKIKPKYLNLGVYITHRDLTLALTSNKGFTKKKGLIKWQNIILPENLQPESSDFPAFLSRCLDNFLEGKKRISIWCALESSSLKIRNIIIPDVPRAKIANAAFWGLKKETDFNETLEIFNFESLGNITIDGIKKKNLLTFCAPKDEIRSLEKTFIQAGYVLTGITSIPFAIQNFVRTGQIQTDDPYFAIVNISSENSEIYCFSQAGMLLVRNLRIGSRNLIEELDAPQGMDPIDHLSSMTNKGTNGFSQIKDICERLINKIVRTGDYCAQHFTGNTPIKQYVFYGDTDQCKPFMHLVSAMIPAAVDTFEPIRDSLPGSIEAKLPQNAKQRNCVLTAFGIGLSTNDISPNFLFTFDDRQKEKKQRNITKATVLAGILLLAACFSAQSLLNIALKKENTTLARLNREQTKFGKNIQNETITKAITIAEVKNNVKKQYIASYIPLAVIYDICHFTPEQIQLTSMTYNRIRDKENKVSKKLFVQGQVSAHPYSLDSELGSYILKLSESPVFGDIEITSKLLNPVDQKKSLLFKATLEVL